MLRIVTTFLALSILGIALSGVAAFGASPPAARVARYVSVDSVASLRCGTTAEPAGQSRVAVGAAGGTSRLVYGFLGCDGSERRLAAFGGRLEIDSPAGGPTRITVAVPCVLS